MIRIWLEPETVVEFCVRYKATRIDDGTFDGYCFDCIDSLLILRWLLDNAPATVVRWNEQTDFIGVIYQARIESVKKGTN